MPGPKNKNHYSYEEMLDRLREARSGSRSTDGSKRKRRSYQPVEEKRKRLQRIAILSAALVLIAITVPVVLFMVGRGSYETEAFRLSVSNSVASMLQREVDFGRFQLNGSSLTSPLFEVTDREDAGFFHKAQLTGLRGDLKSNFHFGTEWPFSKVVVEQAEVNLGRQSGEEPRRIPPSPAQLEKAKFGLSPSPTAIVIDDVFIRNFNVWWGNPGAKDTLQNAKLQAKIVGRTIGWQLADGRLKFGGLPPISVANLAGELSNDVLKIETGRVGYDFANGEEGTVSGTIDFGGKGGADIDIALKGIKVNRWIEGDWVDRIPEGKLAMNAKYEASFAKGLPSKMSGDFTITDLTLRDWHLFECMAIIFNESNLNILNFRKITGSFSWSPGRLILNDVMGEHRGILKMVGDVSIFESGTGGGATIEGVLKLGIPSVDLLKYPGGQPSFFSEPENGFSWTAVKLTGPLDEPVHNFLDRLDEGLRAKLPIPPWEMGKTAPAPPPLDAIPGIDQIPDN